MNEHDRQILGLKNTLEGDPAKRYTGLLDRMGSVEQLVEAIIRTHRDVRIGLFVVLLLLGVISAGGWPVLIKLAMTILGG